MEFDELDVFRNDRKEYLFLKFVLWCIKTEDFSLFVTSINLF